jgi:hypothetical protein
LKSIHYGLALSLLASIACGGGDQTTTDGGSGNDSGTGNDSATGNDTGTSSKSNVGYVTFSQTKTGNTDTFTAAAAFLALGDAGTTTGTGCSGTQSGSCCYVPPSSGSDAGTSSGGTAIGAGALTIKDGTTTLATMTPSGASYTPVTNPPTTALTWNAGDTLAVSAAGDAVHAFNGNVTAVGALLGVTPALSLTTPVLVSRASDFNVKWTSATGAIQLVLVALKGTSADGTITCSSATDPGTMTVPSTLLQKFSAADTGIISLSRTMSADASPDNATVTLSSSTSISGTATFN